MINILCSSFSFPSGRILKELLEQKGNKVRLTSYPERLEKLRLFPSIRYGNSFGTFKTDTFLNSPEFIRLCASKLAFSKLLESGNLYTPHYSKNPKEITSYPVLIRKSLSLSGGKGIILCPDQETFSKNWDGSFWTKYVKTEFELRVHVLGGEIVRIFRKDLENEAEFPIRNNQTCHFSLKEITKYPKLQDVIGKFNAILREKGLNFGYYALDIGWDSVKKEYFIFESNSAPGLNEHTAELYSDFMIKSLSEIT